MQSEPDQLSKRLYKGDSSAFVELYDRLGEKIYRYVFSQVRSAEDATDIVQDTFVQLVKSHRKLGRAKNVSAYTFAVARNEMIRTLKRKNKFKVESDSSTCCEPSTEPTLDSDDSVSHLMVLLKPIDQEIVQLKVFSQMTFQEISEITGLQPANVATRYRRALLKLESHLAFSKPALIARNKKDE